MPTSGAVTTVNAGDTVTVEIQETIYHPGYFRVALSIGRRVVSRFGSLTLPYQLGTAASFDYAGFNGRALNDNVMDNMLSLLTNSPLGTGVRPDPELIDLNFPYFQPISRTNSH